MDQLKMAALLRATAVTVKEGGFYLALVIQIFRVTAVLRVDGDRSVLFCGRFPTGAPARRRVIEYGDAPCLTGCGTTRIPVSLI